MRILPSLIACALICLTSLQAEVLVKNGETVAFLGDSITAQGAGSPGGYVRLVGSGLAANGIDITIIPAGVSGHKSDQMLARLGGILAQKPDWLTLSCGVNDVMHGAKGIPLPEYKKNIAAILDQCKTAQVKVLIMTSTQIRLPITNPSNVQLADYNEFLRAQAEERDLPLADLSAAMLATQEADQAAGLDRSLTVDGVHMNIYGNLMMAKGVLAGFGLDDAQIAKAQEAWLDTPDTCRPIARLHMTLRDQAKLEALAKTKKISADNLINQIATQAINEVIESSSK